MIIVLSFKSEIANGKRRDWVLVAPPGQDIEKVQTWHRVSDLQPKGDESVQDTPQYQVVKARWDVISKAYDAWLLGEEIPDNGTPLAAWAGVSQEQANYLKTMRIRTVEEVAAMTDGQMAAYPFPSARKLPSMAKGFLESRSEVEKDAKIAAMQERMDAMEEMLAASQPEKRGPGRPKKVDEAA